jgi:hypothetical protein
LINDGVKQSSDRDQNVNKSQVHNQAKEGTEEGSIQQVDSEAQNLGNDTINGKEDLGERLKSDKKGNLINLRFKTYKKGPFSIHLKVRRPDTPLVQGRK